MIRKLVFIYEDYLKVIEYFNTHNENESKNIAKFFNIDIHRVDYYIDVYLSMKNNYLGGDVTPPSSIIKLEYAPKAYFKGTKTNLYINGIHHGEFINIRKVEDYLNLSIRTPLISDLNHFDEVTFNSSKLGKEIKLVKL